MRRLLDIAGNRMVRAAQAGAVTALWGVMLCMAMPITMSAQQRASGSTAAQVAERRKAARDSVVQDSIVRVALAADERFYYERLMGQRTRYLAGASWAELGDRCNPGALRVFANALSFGERDSLQKLVQHMEQTLIARGVGARLDTPDAAALLRTIVGWEAGIDRPRWDVDDGSNRVAFAAGLTGEVPDPNGTGCLASPVKRDTVTLVLPGFRAMEFPRSSSPRLKAYFGPQAQQKARDEFAKSHALQGNLDELTYILVAPIVMWREWALVGVNRPKEKGGVEIGADGNGGAVYMMRRVDGQWRLLTVVRSWGS